MRKYVSILMAVMLVAGFATMAAAATLEECCETCKCPLRSIPCEGQEVLQSGVVGDCLPFDYDTEDPYVDVTGGFCTDTMSEPSLRNCKAIFNICCCEDQTAFVSGAEIGIKMTILVDGQAGDNGVYFYGPNGTPNALVRMYPSVKKACDDDTTTFRADSFGPFQYYLANGDLGSPDAGTDCKYAAGDRVVVAKGSNLVTIVEDDIKNKLSYWWLNIPPMIIDPTIAPSCKIIELQIQLESSKGSLCEICTCTCIIQIAKICCDCDVSDSGCIYYPYVIAGQQDEGWMTGISFINMGSVPMAEMEVTFTLTDSKGNVFTKTVTGFEVVVYQKNVDELISEFGWVGVEAGPCTLKLTSNFKMDGYSFNLSTAEGYNFGAGVLARFCCEYNCK